MWQKARKAAETTAVNSNNQEGAYSSLPPQAMIAAIVSVPAEKFRALPRTRKGSQFPAL